MTLCSDEMPTSTCTPQISIWRPHPWVRLISSAYRGESVSFWADHFANGWVPAQKSSMPRLRTTWRAGRRVDRRSSIAWPALSQIPVTTSTVLRSSSLCTRGFSPISAMTAVASLLRSRLSASTRANSHSTPTVGRGERAKSIRFAALRTGRLAGPLSGSNDTARHPLAGVTGGHRRLVGGPGPVDLVAVRNVHEIVRSGVDHDRGLAARQQLVHGEAVRGGNQHPRTVLTHLQRRQVSAGVSGGPRRREVSAGGEEVAGRPSGRGDRIGFALAHLVDMHAVEA